jgi:hypothetical protein
MLGTVLQFLSSYFRLFRTLSFSALICFFGKKEKQKHSIRVPERAGIRQERAGIRAAWALEGLSEEQVSLSPEDRATCRQAKWRSAHGGLA